MGLDSKLVLLPTLAHYHMDHDEYIDPKPFQSYLHCTSISTVTLYKPHVYYISSCSIYNSFLLLTSLPFLNHVYKPMQWIIQSHTLVYISWSIDYNIIYSYITTQTHV